MTLKAYNLEGQERAGQTFVGNWFEDRQWKEDTTKLMKTGHGLDLTAQPGYENAQFHSETQEAYKRPDVRHKKVPPRQAMRERQEATTITRDLKTEELAAEDHSMHFTRGRYLHQPQIQKDLKLDYMSDEPITLYSDRPNHNFGRNSLFSQPIQDYTGHEKVKDV